MRFMILLKANADTESGKMPSMELLTAMQKYNEELAAAGVILAGEGLQASSKGARIYFKGKTRTVVDGPFAEAKELIGGYAMINVKSEQEALDWVKRWPAMDSGGNVELQLRRVFEDDEFGDEFTPELREREQRMRAEAAAKLG